MLILTSSAKRMDIDNARTMQGTTQPLFEKEALEITNALKQFDKEKAMKALHVDEKRVDAVYEHIHNFEKLKTAPSLFAYGGLMYKHLDAMSLGKTELKYLEHHLLILSNLYGILRPTDEVREYRVVSGMTLSEEMGTVEEFWRPKITDYVIERVKKDDGILLHLANHNLEEMLDYEKVKREVKVLVVEFREQDGEELRAIRAYLKIARGAFIRYLAVHKISKPEELKEIVVEGYRFRKSKSDEFHFVYVRPYKRKED